jgi:Cd2+/Zn2+-exporting ATPase
MQKASLLCALIYRVGQLTEDYALNRSKTSISKLLDLKPESARVFTPFGYQNMHPEMVKLGDRVMVKPGEKIPLDGTVISGASSVDAAMLTGESLPVAVEIESEVFAGTVNQDGVIEIQVTKIYQDSAVAKILKLVSHANGNKAVTERFIRRFAKVYTPIVVLLGGMIAFVPSLVFGGALETWLYRGAIFLVVSCPCALVISIPLGYFGGIGGAARKGILVKGGRFLEVLTRTKTLIVDKTGTLTKGNFKVSRIKVLNGYKEDEILSTAAHLEAFSNHPIAKAVVNAYKKPVDMDLVKEVKEVPGKGIKGLYQGSEVLIGNLGMMKQNAIQVSIEKTHQTSLYLAVDGSLAGILYIEDEIKDHSKEGIQALKKLGFSRIVMLTGDQKGIAEAVGQTLGIDEVHAELLPEEKLSHVEALIEESGPVIFVGDGINDAPVLARADVGISMGELGSDVAIESSDVVLMTDEITKVAEAVKGAHFTSKIVWQNIILALGIKLVIMILGVFGIGNLWTAVFGDVGVAFLAILNAGRAIYQK